MSYWLRVMPAAIAILLFGCALWANMTKAPMPEMRGAWVTQAMRGMVY